MSHGIREKKRAFTSRKKGDLLTYRARRSISGSAASQLRGARKRERRKCPVGGSARRGASSGIRARRFHARPAGFAQPRASFLDFPGNARWKRGHYHSTVLFIVIGRRAGEQFDALHKFRMEIVSGSLAAFRLMRLTFIARSGEFTSDNYDCFLLNVPVI